MKKRYVFNVVGAALLFFVSLFIICLSVIYIISEAKSYFQIIGLYGLVDNFNILVNMGYRIFYGRELAIIPGLVTLAIMLLINPKKKLKILYLIPFIYIIGFYVLKLINFTIFDILQFIGNINLANQLLMEFAYKKLVWYRVLLAIIFEEGYIVYNYITYSFLISGILLLCINTVLSMFNKRTIPFVFPLALFIIHFIFIFSINWEFFSYLLYWCLDLLRFFALDGVSLFVVIVKGLILNIPFTFLRNIPYLLALMFTSFTFRRIKNKN